MARHEAGCLCSSYRSVAVHSSPKRDTLFPPTHELSTSGSSFVLYAIRYETFTSGYRPHVSCHTFMSSAHPRDPLHGITLETIIKELVERYGWAEMGRRVPIRCFLHDPSVKSSLTFLRKTPWARERVEGWYIAYKDM